MAGIHRLLGRSLFVLVKQENLKDAFLSSSLLALHSFYNHLHSQPVRAGIVWEYRAGISQHALRLRVRDTSVEN